MQRKTRKWWTYKLLSEYLGVTPMWISRVDRGIYESPMLYKKIQIAKKAIIKKMKEDVKKETLLKFN